MTSATPDVLVVGAGVTGLTTAVCLAEAGLRVRILAASPPAETTSAAAGAIWGPHLVEEGDRVARWGAQTMAVLRELAQDPATGVRICDGVQASRQPDGLPAALPGLPDARRCAPAELPPGFAAGWRYSAPLVTMPAYLAYLARRLARAGGELTAGTVTSLAGAADRAGAPIVVNCTGTGSRELAGDPAVTPIRGQVVVVANPGLAEFLIGLPDRGGVEGSSPRAMPDRGGVGGSSPRASTEGAELVYVFPHGDIALLGGTETAGDWSLAPDPAVAERILADCAAAVPRLRGAEVLGHRVGLRPFRPSVRVTAGPPAAGDGPLVLHNYGHGGAGVTLSWGCAREITALALAAPSRHPRR